MGSDIGIIIPCEFREVKNKRKAEAYIHQIADNLRKTLRIEGVMSYMNDDYCDGCPLKEEWPEYLPEIWVPEYDANILSYCWCCLHMGYIPFWYSHSHSLFDGRFRRLYLFV